MAGQTAHFQIDRYLKCRQQEWKNGKLQEIWQLAVQKHKSGRALLLPKMAADWVVSEEHATLADIYNSDDYLSQMVMNIFRGELKRVEWQGHVFLTLMNEILQDLHKFVTGNDIFSFCFILSKVHSASPNPNAPNTSQQFINARNQSCLLTRNSQFLIIPVIFCF